MCGFVGFIDQIENKEPVLKEMMNTIIHRGPDSEGIFMDDQISLGFRRLSIVDLEHGKQPMQNETGSLVLSFNGEIYNYPALREELINKGHTFQTHSDSEVLIHGYEEYGQDLVNKLRGMFAFVLWDTKKQELFACRDYFGIKPFYYTVMDNSFIFGSEIKALIKHPAVTREFNEEMLEPYLSFQFNATDETFFKGIFKLAPGHFMTYKAGEIDVKRYWEPEFKEEATTFEAHAEEVEDVLQDSIKAHHIADVEVGCFLSGGVDSNYVASNFGGTKSFTVGFEQKGYSEVDLAKDYADELGLDSYQKFISKDEFWGVLDKVQYHFDEPVADPSAVALYYVNKLASEHVKVVLSGEGADEIFGGYNIYREPMDLAAYKKIPRPIRRGVASIARHLPDVKGKSFLIRGSQELEEKYIGNANIFKEHETKKVLKNATGKTTPKHIMAPIYKKVSAKDEVTKMQYVDINTWLIGDILQKADKMSMAHSVEVRVPFLDKPVFNVARKLPREFKVNQENTKFLFRKVAMRKIPEHISKRKKLGFPVPIRVWLREEDYYNKVKSTLTSEHAEKFFNTNELVRLLDNHKNSKADNSRKIWTVYVFLIWYNQYFG